MDEKWAFVGKKESHCDPENPDDDQQGDHWDHVALDAEHRLVLAVVPGKRTAENVQALVCEAKRRTGARIPNLITTDEYPAYETAILEAYGKTVVPKRTGKPGRPAHPYRVPPKDLNYATVHKTREKGRVVKILHFLRKRLTLWGQGHKAIGQLGDFPWQPPDGGKRR